MAQTDRWPDGGNDTDLDYYDTPAGNTWRQTPRPGTRPGSPIGAARRRTGHDARNVHQEPTAR